MCPLLTSCEIVTSENSLAVPVLSVRGNTSQRLAGGQGRTLARALHGCSETDGTARPDRSFCLLGIVFTRDAQERCQLHAARCGGCTRLVLSPCRFLLGRETVGGSKTVAALHEERSAGRRVLTARVQAVCPVPCCQAAWAQEQNREGALFHVKQCPGPKLWSQTVPEHSLCGWLG